MKKIGRTLAFLACAALCFGLSACDLGAGNESGSSVGDATASSSIESGSSIEEDSSLTETSSHEHSYEERVVAPTCTSEGYTEYTCSCGDSYVGDSVGVIDHTYNQENPIAENKAEDATCASGALYFLTCTCGAKSEDTFAFGAPLPHPKAEEWTFDETHHWHAVTCGCDAKEDLGEHEEKDGYCSVCELCMTSTPGVHYLLSDDGEYAKVISYKGTFKHVKIADTYEGKPVKEIGVNAFKGTEIVSVEFPETLELIWYDAFNGCASLKSLTFPDSVTEIGSQAFCMCTSLESVTFGENSRLQYIGEGAFAVCRELKDFVFGDTCEVVVLLNLTFNLCDKLNYTKYGNALYLGSKENPYMYCIKAESKDCETYTIHEKTKVIADNAFEDCKLFTEITIPMDVITIGAFAFNGCKKLERAVFENQTGWWYGATSGDTSGTLIEEKYIIYPANAASGLVNVYYWKWLRRSDV